MVENLPTDNYLQRLNPPDPLAELAGMGIRSITLDDPLPGDTENRTGRQVTLTSQEFVDLLPSTTRLAQMYGFPKLLSGIKRQLYFRLRQTREEFDMPAPIRSVAMVGCLLGAMTLMMSPEIKLPYSMIQALTLELKYGIPSEANGNFAYRYEQPLEKYDDSEVDKADADKLRTEGNVLLVGAFAPTELIDPYGSIGLWLRQRRRNPKTNEMWWSIPGGKGDIADVKTGEIVGVRELGEETGLRTVDFRRRVRALGMADQVMMSTRLGVPVRYWGLLLSGVLFQHENMSIAEFDRLSVGQKQRLLRKGKKEYYAVPKPINGDGNGEWILDDNFIEYQGGLGYKGGAIELSPIARLFMRHYRCKL